MQMITLRQNAHMFDYAHGVHSLIARILCAWFGADGLCLWAHTLFDYRSVISEKL